MLEKLKEFIGSAQLTSATVTAKKKPYTGKYPDVSKIKRDYFQKGDKGAEIVKLQNYLNWYTDGAFFKKCGKADGIYGNNTLAYVKKMQAKFFGKTEADGLVGKKTIAKMKAYSNSFKPKPKPTPTPEKKAYTGSYPTTAEIAAASRVGIYKGIANWCKQIADSGKYGYVHYSDAQYTHECPICHKRTYDLGWNCIGYAFASLRHGGGISSRCSCDVIYNSLCDRWVDMSNADVLSSIRGRTGISDIQLIRNNNNRIPDEMLQKGDLLFFYNRDNTYQHMGVYVGSEKIADCTDGRSKEIIYGSSYNSYNNSMPCLFAIRYVGSRNFLKQGDQGAAVTKVQNYLNWYTDGKFFKECGKADGIYGANTAKYVKKMQTELLGAKEADGSIGVKTLAAMKKVKK